MPKIRTKIFNRMFTKSYLVKSRNHKVSFCRLWCLRTLKIFKICAKIVLKIKLVCENVVTRVHGSYSLQLMSSCPALLTMKSLVICSSMRGYLSIL